MVWWPEITIYLKIPPVVSLPEWLRGVDLRSTGGNSAWVRAPQMTEQRGRWGYVRAHVLLLASNAMAAQAVGTLGVLVR